MRYKCKKTYKLENGSGIIIFEKGKYYIEDFKFITSIYNGGELYHTLLTPDYPPYFTISESNINEHFYSIDEVREMEINKILEI